MKVEVHAEYESRLPADDDHPYRTGAWRPQTTEYDAWDLDVEGEIPRDLAGSYLRNTENPVFPPIRKYHPFDGDGMLHSISFADGEAIYRNRFVPTDGLAAEREAGEALWAGIAEAPHVAKGAGGWGARGRMKDASSTDVVAHRGLALTSFWQCGDLYRFDPRTLEYAGKEELGGAFPFEGISAHPKVDENEDEMLFFNYGKSAPFMNYGVVDGAGQLVHYTPIELPGPRLPHDMAYTENYAILNDCPMFWDPAGLAQDFSRDALLSRSADAIRDSAEAGDGSEIRWFEAEPTYVLHWINAYEDGDEIVLDGFFQANPSPEPRTDRGIMYNLLRYLDLHEMQSYAHRWRFNLANGECREEHLSDRVMEFGMINGRFGGRPYRYSFNALPAKGWFGFEGFVRQDMQTGREDVVQLPEGVYASETVMAPRVGATAEDDGYVLTFTMDLNRDRSECLVFDAAHPLDGPVARISLPERICSGTHAFWHAAKVGGEMEVA